MSAFEDGSEQAKQREQQRGWLAAGLEAAAARLMEKAEEALANCVPVAYEANDPVFVAGQIHGMRWASGYMSGTADKMRDAELANMVEEFGQGAVWIIQAILDRLEVELGDNPKRRSQYMAVARLVAWVVGSCRPGGIPRHRARSIVRTATDRLRAILFTDAMTPESVANALGRIGAAYSMPLRRYDVPPADGDLVEVEADLVEVSDDGVMTHTLPHLLYECPEPGEWRSGPSGMGEMQGVRAAMHVPDLWRFEAAVTQMGRPTYVGNAGAGDPCPPVQVDGYRLVGVSLSRRNGPGVLTVMWLRPNEDAQAAIARHGVWSAFGPGEVMVAEDGGSFLVAV